MEHRRVGRYELVRVLGSGGAGRVYEALRENPDGTRTPVALKVLHERSASLWREARMGGLLRHRNLVDVYEVGEVDGRAFCAMELCPGSVADLTPLSPRAAVEVGLQVCEALRYAHEELGLVHADLKPENLLVSRAGAVKVADLGIAEAEGFDSDGHIRGTPGYMPPEQARGELLDPRADIYALGATLVELATGVRPGAASTFTWGSDETEAPEVQAGDGVPDWLQPVAVRCLAPERGDRWPHMAALAERLRAMRVEGQGLLETLGRDAQPPPQERSTARSPIRGRELLLEQIADTLHAPGALTLHGPPGIGKSRLARDAARRWSQGPTWWCDASTARTEDELCSAVGRCLALAPDPRHPAAHVARVLEGRGEALLVLDTFEHLLHGTPMLAAWLAAAPRLRLLVTSRAALELVGSQTLVVPPLEGPAAEQLIDDRARARGASVAGHPRLAELAKRLEGVPLALELAAGRLGVLSVDDVLDRLDLSLLRSSSTHRHGTLRAALAWSWDLLEPPEQQALAQLSVFRGGFPLAAVDPVVRVPGALPSDLVASLVRASLVGVGPSGRFQVLASVRDFAAERLDDAGAAEARHGVWAAGFGTEEMSTGLMHLGGAARRRMLTAELANLVAACERALQRADPRVAVPTVRAAWAVLVVTGPLGLASELVRRVAALSGLTDTEQLVVSQTYAQICAAEARHDEALGHYADALDRARATGNRLEQAKIRGNRSICLWRMGRLEDARSENEEALALYTAIGEPAGMGLALGSRGSVCRAMGQLTEAERHYRASLALLRERGARRLVAIVLGNLATLLAEGGRISEGLACSREVLSMARAEEDTLTEAATLGHLGKMYRFTGQLQEARQALEHGLRIHLEMGHRHGAVAARLALGTVSADCGAWGPARSHLTRALAEAVDTDNYLAEVEALLELSWVERSIGDLDAALAVSTRAVERARSGAKPQALARALGHLASLFGPRGDAGAEAMSAEGIGLLRAHGPPAMLGHWLVWRARLPGLPLVEAAALLDEGAPLVRAEGRPDRLVQLCVALAHVAVRAGDGAAARRWLEVARGHVPDGHVRAQLEIQRAEAGRVD